MRSTKTAAFGIGKNPVDVQVTGLLPVQIEFVAAHPKHSRESDWSADTHQNAWFREGDDWINRCADYARYRFQNFWKDQGKRDWSADVHAHVVDIWEGSKWSWCWGHWCQDIAIDNPADGHWQCFAPPVQRDDEVSQKSFVIDRNAKTCCAARVGLRSTNTNRWEQERWWACILKGSKALVWGSLWRYVCWFGQSGSSSLANWYT